jgi:glutathione-regulated potassium-efflux system ancillary protein KefG
MVDPTEERRILVLFAHPAFEKSRVNRRLVGAIEQLEGVTVNDLYESYPDFDVDVEREQELLVAHEVLVLQHPFYWYSAPALLKEWMDLVLEHGWAYGAGGDALVGKKAMSAITVGGGEASYSPGGVNHFTMRQLLTPVEQTFRLCGVEYLPPFVVHGTHQLGDSAMTEHERDYERVICALRDDRVDLAAARECTRINHHLDRLIRD